MPFHPLFISYVSLAIATRKRTACYSAFSKIWSRCHPFPSTHWSWLKGPQGPFSTRGKCRNTAGDSQESTCRSSGGSRVLLNVLLLENQRLTRGILYQATVTTVQGGEYQVGITNTDFKSKFTNINDHLERKHTAVKLSSENMYGSLTKLR